MSSFQDKKIHSSLGNPIFTELISKKPPEFLTREQLNPVLLPAKCMKKVLKRVNEYFSHTKIVQKSILFFK